MTQPKEQRLLPVVLQDRRQWAKPETREHQETQIHCEDDQTQIHCEGDQTRVYCEGKHKFM